MNLLQVVDGNLHLAIGEIAFRQDLMDIAEFSNFQFLSEAMTTVCYPKPKRALLNILRPFGQVLLTFFNYFAHQYDFPGYDKQGQIREDLKKNNKLPQ